MNDQPDSSKQILVVHHTVSPSTAALLDAVVEGLQVEELEGLEVITAAALNASVAQTLSAAGVVLLSPVNIGYLSGAMKHYFDQIYYPCLESTHALPYAAILHSNQDAAGALRGLSAITTGLDWQAVGDPLVIAGEPAASDLDQVRELASTAGAYALGLIS